MNMELTNPLWEKIAEKCAEALRMTEKEAQAFRANKIARLVGLLPFIAGCDDAERTALAHLSVFVVANRGQARHVFDHSPADDAEPLARLRTIADFKGGDAPTLERGMALLGICMVSGYRRDAGLDRITGAYNPVTAAPSFADKAEGTFRLALDSKVKSGLDSVLTEEEAVGAYWKD